MSKYKKGENFKSMKEFNEYFESNEGYYYEDDIGYRSGYPMTSLELAYKYQSFKNYAPAIEIKEEKLCQVIGKKHDYKPLLRTELYSSKDDFLKRYDYKESDYEWIKLKQVNLDEWS